MNTPPSADNLAERTANDSVPAPAQTRRPPEIVLSVSEPEVPAAVTASKQPPFALRWLSYLLVIPLVGLATAGFGCISLLCGLWDKSGRQQYFIARLWAR